MATPSELRDDAERHNPLIPLALGVLALARPLEAALANAAKDGGMASGGPPVTAVASHARECLLGVLSISSRIKREVERACAGVRVDRGQAPGEPRPASFLR